MNCTSGAMRTAYSSKESKHVLSREDPHGSEFELLGVKLGCRLPMGVAIGTLVGQLR